MGMLKTVYIINFLLFKSNNTIYNSYLAISEDLLPFLWVPLCVFPEERKSSYYFAKIVSSTHAVKNSTLHLKFLTF